MTVTAEGLRIELLESEKGTFFESGSLLAEQKWSRNAWIVGDGIGKVPNRVSIEGHTDAKPFVGKGNYSNWELSSDRANAARRLMQQADSRTIKSRKCEALQINGYGIPGFARSVEPPRVDHRAIHPHFKQRQVGSEDDQGDSREQSAASGRGKAYKNKRNESSSKKGGWPCGPARKMLSYTVTFLVNVTTYSATYCVAVRVTKRAQWASVPMVAGLSGLAAYANVPTRPTNSSNALSERFIFTFSLGSA